MKIGYISMTLMVVVTIRCSPTFSRTHKDTMKTDTFPHVQAIVFALVTCARGRH